MVPTTLSVSRSPATAPAFRSVLARAALVVFALVAGCAPLPGPDGGWAVGADAKDWRLRYLVVGNRLATAADWSELTVVRGGRRVATEPGMALAPGDEVSTSPRAVAVLGYNRGRSEVVLYLDTRVRLNFELLFGRIFASLRDLLKTETEFATAIPEGTRLQVDVARGGRTRVTVVDGRVRVESPQRAWPSRVLEPYEQGLTVAGSPLEVRTLSPEEFNPLVEWVNRIERIVRPDRPGLLVPKLTGLEEVEAGRVLAREDLKVGRHLPAFGPGRLGTVVDQRPAAGTEVRPGTPVDLSVLARGARVPDLVGRPRGEAEALLERAGLRVRQVHALATTERSPGEVVRQEPPPGETVPPGIGVDLWVAGRERAPAQVEVPNVVGQPADEARESLAAAGLGAGARSAVQSGRYRPGTVVRQRPASGARVDPGSTVALWVEEGAPETPSDLIAVPGVEGLQEAQARSRVSRAGLEADVDYVPDRTHKIGTVVNQRPRGGERVERGSVVRLVVARATRATEDTRCTVPSVLNRDEASALAALERAGLKGRVATRVGRGQGYVSRQEPSAGARVPCASTVELTMGVLE